MSEPIQFSLSKRWLIFLAVSLGVSVLLFFSAGLVAGLLLQPTQAARGVLSAELYKQKKPQFAAVNPVAIVRNPSLSADGPQVGPRYPQLTLQVASFEDPARAQSFADSLKRARFPVLPLATMQLGDKTWQTVLVGPYPNWDQAARVAADLQRSYNVDVYVRLR